MSLSKRKVNFRESQEGQDAEATLLRMAADDIYNTTSTYSTHIDYPDHTISFTAKHMRYLDSHPNVDPQQYLANLRLMTKVR